MKGVQVKYIINIWLLSNLNYDFVVLVFTLDEKTGDEGDIKGVVIVVAMGQGSASIMSGWRNSSSS